MHAEEERINLSAGFSIFKYEKIIIKKIKKNYDNILRKILIGYFTSVPHIRKWTRREEAKTGIPL